MRRKNRLKRIFLIKEKRELKKIKNVQHVFVQVFARLGDQDLALDLVQSNTCLK